MSAEKNSAGISVTRAGVEKAPNGIKSISIDKFESGEVISGQHIENLVNSGGTLKTVAPPVILGKTAIKYYELENLLYSFGPGSTLGTDTFYCSGTGTQSNTYSGTSLIKKTFSFDNPLETDEYTFFEVNLTAGTYMLHIDLGTTAQQKKLGIKFMNAMEDEISYQEVDEHLSGGRYYADVSLSASSEASYKIGFAPVYGSGTEYTISFCKLYLFDKGAASTAGCAESVLNSASFNGRYKTVEGIYTITGNNISASIVSGENEYFIIEGDIFRKGGDDLIYLIGENVIETGAGAFYMYDGEIFVTDGTRIIAVSEEDCPVAEPNVPVCVKNCTYDASDYDLNEKVNVLTPYIDIQYLMSYEVTRRIPEIYLTDGTCVVTLSDGTVLGESDYSVAVTNGVTVITLSSSRSCTMTVRVKLAGDISAAKISHGNSAGMRSAFFGTKKFINITGGNDGKNVLFAYNDKVFLMQLSGGAYLNPENQVMSVGGEITAMLPYEEGYFVFSRNFIKRLMISESTGEMTLLSFKNDFGCDMPGSAVSERDKIIFANSQLGVFFINRYGVTEKDISRRASANIEKYLRSYENSALESCKSVCVGGKYYLFIGNDTYVWDWYKKIPSASQTEDDEKKLVWYIFSGIGVKSLMNTRKSRLYFYGSDGMGYFSCEISESNGMNGTYKSGTLYPVDRFTEKVLSEISVSAKLNGDAELVMYCDGALLPDEYTLKATGTDTVYHIRLPLRKFFGLNVKISGSKMELSGIKLKYYVQP